MNAARKHQGDVAVEPTLVRWMTPLEVTEQPMKPTYCSSGQCSANAFTDWSVTWGEPAGRWVRTALQALTPAKSLPFPCIINASFSSGPSESMYRHAERCPVLCKSALNPTFPSITPCLFTSSCLRDVNTIYLHFISPSIDMYIFWHLLHILWNSPFQREVPWFSADSQVVPPAPTSNSRTHFSPQKKCHAHQQPFPKSNPCHHVLAAFCHHGFAQSQHLITETVQLFPKGQQQFL